MKELSIRVREMAGIEGVRPVTGGVPIAEGDAPHGAAFALRDDQGKAVPLQSCVLAPWKDGSARWVLLDFQSAPPAGGSLGYVLSRDEGAGAEVPDAVVCEDAEKGPVLRSGDVTISLAEGALLNISERLELVLSLTDSEGRLCEAAVESCEVETAGKMRSTLSLVGSFRTPAGERVFQFRLRASVYAGLSAVRLEPLILVDADKGIVQRIGELKLALRPRSPVGRARLGGSPGWEGSAGSAVRLFQYDDQNYRLEGADGDGGRAPGWAEIEDGRGSVAVALREFWQQWPKSLEVSPEGLSVGLFPGFTEGDYAHMEPWYKHQYLFEGNCYRLHTGQARRWEVWVDLAGDGQSLSRGINAPLIAAADPAQAIVTGLWDAIAPAGTPQMADYEGWAERMFDGYCRSVDQQRDYGAMNWGDWFGERKVNWGNHEYDTTNQILIQFARTGDPKYLYVAQAAGRHSSEVDTVHCVNDDLAKYFNDMKPCIEGPPSPDMEDHGIDNVAGLHSVGYPPRAGMVHEHSVGHVGGFYSIERIRELYIEMGIGGEEKNPYLCLDPFNLGHVWTQGMTRLYFLTGDPFLKETVERIGANLAQLVEDREYQFIGHTHCGRIAGWTLLALGGAYEIGLDERYLNAMKTISEDAMAEQDPNCGGWIIHPMVHCHCKRAKHTGMAGFVTAVLINGLSRYCLLSGDARLPDAIERAVTFLDDDTWREERRGWRGSSCPATTRSAGQPGVTVMAHVNGIRIAENAEHLRILRVAWDAKFRRLREAPPPGPGQGKVYGSSMYGCAEAVGLLATKAG